MINLVKLRDCPEHNGVAIKLLNQYIDFLYNEVPVTEESHKKFIASPDRGSEYLWAIEKDGIVCGIVSVYHIDNKNRKCEWGRFMVDENHKGVGSVVEYMVLDFVFNVLNMNKLYCEVLIMNDPVISMHKKFGFATEGMLLDHVYKKGTPMDVMYLALKKSEWSAYQDRFAKLFSKKIGFIQN
jgi:RimJ/RimL family protein N-acetyltransferase